jgi:hypothetical protein
MRFQLAFIVGAANSLFGSNITLKPKNRGSETKVSYFINLVLLDTYCYWILQVSHKYYTIEY